jgi:hypothetical protein
MAKKYDAKNTAATGGRANAKPKAAPKVAPRKDCRTCDNTRQVQVAPPKGSGVRTRQQYYSPRSVPCPDC